MQRCRSLDGLDPALAESTNGALKVELVNRRHCATRDEAERAIAAYIEVFYNRGRQHGTAEGSVDT
jgi:transposase InsO family protein